jgi:hypothetical protein
MFGLGKDLVLVLLGKEVSISKRSPNRGLAREHRFFRPATSWYAHRKNLRDWSSLKPEIELNPRRHFLIHRYQFHYLRF